MKRWNDETMKLWKPFQDFEMKTQSLNPKIVQSLKSYWRKPATHQVLHYAMSPSGIPAHHVFGYLNLWERTRILKEELSIRFAHQVRNLVRLPYGMPHLRDIKDATDLHIKSFNEISKFPQPYSDEDVKRFVDHIEEVNSGHLNVRDFCLEIHTNPISSSLTHLFTSSLK